MKNQLILFAFFFLMCKLSIAQEKLTSFNGGFPQTQFNKIEFNGKFYGFQGTSDYGGKIWRFDPSDLSCDTIFQANPKVKTRFRSWVVFKEHLFIFIENKMYEIDDATGQLQFRKEWIGMTKVLHGAETNAFLLMAVFENENSSSSRIFAFDPLTKEELYDFNDLDIAIAISEQFQSNPFDNPYSNEVWMNSYQGVPGVYKYSLLDKDVKIPEGAEVLQGQMMNYTVQFSNNEFFSLDTAFNVWHIDLVTNKATIVFQVPDSVEIRSSVTDSNSFYLIALNKEFSSKATHVFKYDVATDTLFSYVLPDKHFYSFFKLNSTGALVSVDHEYGNRDKLLYWDFITDDVALVLDTFYTPDRLINTDQGNEVYYRTYHQEYGSCIAHTNLLTLETNILDCRKGYVMTLGGFFEEGVYFFMYDSTGTRLYRATPDMLKEVLDVSLGDKGKDFVLLELGNSLITTDNKTYAAKVLPSVKKIKGINFDQPNSWVAVNDDIIYHSDWNGLYYRVDKNSFDAERLKFILKDSTIVYPAQIYSIHQSLYARVRIENNSYACIVNYQTGLVECFMDTLSIDNNICTDLFSVAGQPCALLGDGPVSKPWILTENIEESFLLVDRDIDVIHELTENGITLFGNGNALYRSDSTPKGTYQLGNGQPLWFSDNKFYIYNGFEYKFGYTDGTSPINSLPFLGKVKFETIVGDTIYYTTYDDEARFWGVGMDQFIEMMPVDGDKVSGFYPSGENIFMEWKEDNYSDDVYPQLLVWNFQDGTKVLIDSVGLPEHFRSYMSVGDKLLFSHYGESTGVEIWITDGTLTGTHLLFDIMPGIQSSDPQFLKDYQGNIYFSAKYPNEGRQLFRIAKSDILQTDVTVIPFISFLKFYPNPAMDELHVEMDNLTLTDIQIFTATGQEEKNWYAQNHNSINIASLAPGLYFVTAKTNKERWIGKFIKS